MQYTLQKGIPNAFLGSKSTISSMRLNKPHILQFCANPTPCIPPQAFPGPSILSKPVSQVMSLDEQEKKTAYNVNLLLAYPPSYLRAYLMSEIDELDGGNKAPTDDPSCNVYNEYLRLLGRNYVNTSVHHRQVARQQLQYVLDSLPHRKLCEFMTAEKFLLPKRQPGPLPPIKVNAETVSEPIPSVAPPPIPQRNDSDGVEPLPLFHGLNAGTRFRKGKRKQHRKKGRQSKPPIIVTPLKEESVEEKFNFMKEPPWGEDNIITDLTTDMTSIGFFEYANNDESDEVVFECNESTNAASDRMLLQLPPLEEEQSSESICEHPQREEPQPSVCEPQLCEQTQNDPIIPICKPILDPQVVSEPTNDNKLLDPSNAPQVVPAPTNDNELPDPQVVSAPTNNNESQPSIIDSDYLVVDSPSDQIKAQSRPPQCIVM